jgi:hypothetical protein
MKELHLRQMVNLQAIPLLCGEFHRVRTSKDYVNELFYGNPEVASYPGNGRLRPDASTGRCNTHKPFPCWILPKYVGYAFVKPSHQTVASGHCSANGI